MGVRAALLVRTISSCRLRFVAGSLLFSKGNPVDHATAAKYRVILFGDQEDTNPIPPSLVQLHNFAFQRLQRFGMGGISRELAISVVMDWMQTDEGRAFFADPAEVATTTDKGTSKGVRKEPRLAASV